MTLTFEQWITIIGLTITVLGLLGAGLIYIIRLEGKTNALKGQIQGMEEKVDQILGEMFSILRAFASAAPHPFAAPDDDGKQPGRPPRTRKRSRTSRLQPLRAAGKGREK